MVKALSIIAVLSCMINLPSAGQKVISIWEATPPSNKAHQVEETREVSPWGGAKVLSGVSIPEIWFYKCQSKKACPAVIICPGGGYAKQAYEHEGTEVAQWLNQLGINAFVLKYRLPDEETSTNPTYVPLMDAQRAIQYVKTFATKLNVDENKVGIMGFSAGGHLAASCTNLTDPVDPALGDAPIKPDFSILLYPVISMKDELTHVGSRNNLMGNKPSDQLVNKFSMEEQVSDQTPITFICHAKDDQAVVVRNTEAYAAALMEHNIPAEVHILESGGHGFGMRQDSPAFIWTELLKQWLKQSVLTD